jgi:hypothetical protein
MGLADSTAGVPRLRSYGGQAIDKTREAGYTMSVWPRRATLLP